MILKDTDRKEVYIVKTARREIEGRPVLAVCYDFDRTLSPENMQDGYIRAVDYDVDSFWEESNRLAEDHCMDQNLAYMYKMLQSARGKEILNKERLKQYGGKVRLYDGIKGWFRRINAYGERRGILVEHYIISSGLREIIEGTAIAKYFTHIYASSFYYNEHGEPCWPAQVINYTNKTQFLFRIEKGILDINDNAVNDHFAEGELRVPFRNIVYIGDSATDIPCMRLVNSLGGHSVGVYDSENTDSKDTVRRMIRDERIRYYVPADYTKGSEMDTFMHQIIDKTAAYEVLEEKHLRERVLVDYINDDKYTLSVLINGKWGSGKTFFIKNFMSGLNKKNVYYISLYGIATIMQLNVDIYKLAISRTIDMKLFNKSKPKRLKYLIYIKNKILNCSSKIIIVLKFLLDYLGLNRDKVKEIIGQKQILNNVILVMDDMERCKVPMDELLG